MTRRINALWCRNAQKTDYCVLLGLKKYNYESKIYALVVVTCHGKESRYFLLMVGAQAGRAHLHIGAVAFIHRFGWSLNEHVHFHVCVIDGVFEVVAGEEKSKPSNCNWTWTSRNQPFVAVGVSAKMASCD